MTIAERIRFQTFEPNAATLGHIVSNLRPGDREEALAVCWADDTDEILLRLLALRKGLTWVFGRDEPIAAIGIREKWPAAWEIWMLATPRFPEIALSLSKFVRRSLLPMVFNELDARHIDCHSIATHRAAHDWIVSFGAEQHGPEKCEHGKRGEAFKEFRLTSARFRYVSGRRWRRRS